MIALLGKLASGKTTIERLLCEIYNLNRITSYTTRSMRPNETNGIDYHFISDEEFNQKVVNNELAEHYTAKNGWHYGIDKKDCKNDTICVVTPEGLQQLEEKDDLNIVSIYIKSDKDTRKERAIDRKDFKPEIMRRLKSDDIDFENLEDNVDYVVENNDELEDTFNEIVQILKNNGVID